MEAYLDNSATTRVCPEAAQIVQKLMLEDFGNPSSMHSRGVEAEKYVRSAKETLARILKVREKEIFFTSGGTESDNWAVFGAAEAAKRRGRHIIISAVEHPAVSAPALHLEEQGYEVTRLRVDGNGRVDLDQLADAIRPDTVLVSVMLVNNETGAVEPAEEIARTVRDKNPETWFHADAIQGFGKYRILPKKLGIDLLSVSGHKFHGPKGTGFLYVDGRVKLKPLLYGGGQQQGMRSGTDNVPGIAGLAAAAEAAYRNPEETEVHLLALKKHLTDGLLSMENVHINGCTDIGSWYDTGIHAPHIVNASFTGIRSEVLLHTLEDRGICVSAGSACSSHKRAGSPTLTAIGCSREEMESALRFSFAETTTQEEISWTLSVLREVVPMLRRYTRH